MLVIASMNIGSYVLTFAALSFLGLGAQRGYADWGQMISFARNWIPSLADHWYIVVYPGVAIVLFVLAWNLVGDALRDILDPRMRGGVTDSNATGHRFRPQASAWASERCFAQWVS